MRGPARSSPARKPGAGHLFWWPLLFALTASAAIRILDLDRRCASFFWDAGTQVWRWENVGWVQFLYHYSPYPAIGGAAVGALVCAAYLLRRLSATTARAGAFAVLVLLIGPWLIVNVILKDHFGRPRPREVTLFGGSYEFQPLGRPGTPGRGKSFPCGHASMGFFWLGLALHFRRQQPRGAWMLAGFGLAFGIVIGIARMAQGGHWLSDVLWSAVFVYFTAWFVDRLWFMKAFKKDRPLPEYLQPSAANS